MRVSLKAKLTALISLLVLAVVVATSALYVSLLVRHTLEEVSRRANYTAREVFELARAALKVTPFPADMDRDDPAALRAFVQDTLNADQQLLSAIQVPTSYSQSLDYVAITGSNSRVILDSEPHQLGSLFTPDPSFQSLAQAGLYHQLLVIFGSPRVYQVDFPLTFGREALDVHVGVSSVLLGAEVKPQLNRAFLVSLVAMLLAALVAGMLSYYLLRPLQSISLNVDRLARGELPAPVPASRSDEWGILSSKLNLLGERIRGEKAAFVALKDNLDQLLANLADGLMFFDQQDRLALTTPAAARFISKPANEILRQTPAEIFSADDTLSQFLRQAFSRRTPVNGELVESSPGAKAGKVAVSLAFVEEHGQPVASLVTLRDAESRAEIESQIDTTAKLAAIGRLTSGVAHEVKNPLNSMVLQIEVLKAKLGGQSDAVAPHLEILGNEVRRLDRVVKTFLDFTRPVELRRAELDLGDLMEDVLRTAEPEAHRYQVRMVLERNGAATARVDRDLMKQAMLNLVLNGCQAMPSGGELRVTPRERGDQAEIEISDEGVGIPPNARNRIFSLFYTTKASGSGIGLAMAYRIVQLHNGSIDFTSVPNQGTTFRVTLPRQPA